MALKALYEEHVLPHLINCTCASPAMMAYREKMVALAEGEVLEVGMGSGLNLQFYNPEEVTKVWGLEPSLGMRKKAEKNIVQAPVPVELIGLPGERIPLPDNSVDTVVLFFTLCTIPDWLGALAQMRRVLKPEGKLLFCEHGLSPDKSVSWIQNNLNPAWRHFSGGCQLNRPVIKNLSSHFQLHWHKNEYINSLPKFTGYLSYGEAAKAASRTPTIG